MALSLPILRSPVFVVLVIQFCAFRPALIILSAAPLSLVGAFAMLLVTGTALNVSSFMGIILMRGLVVKNRICRSAKRSLRRERFASARF
jgi:multidrug efflux pump subunit AcrB